MQSIFIYLMVLLDMEYVSYCITLLCLMLATNN